MPNEPTALIWFLVVFFIAALAAFFITAYKLWTVSRDLKALTRTLDRLEARIAEQERQVSELRSALDRRGTDVFAPFVEVFQQIRSKGWTAALSLLGSHLFRSYLGKRRQKSLPAKEDS
jgi:hypothetical protein